MKVIFYTLNHKPERTGIGKYQDEMTKWFVDRGHDVKVVTAPPYYPEWKVSEGYSAWRYKSEKMDGAKVYRIPLYVPTKPSGLKRIIHLASFAFFSAPIMLWQAIRHKPDAILLTAPPLMSAPVALLAGCIGRSKTCLHVQDFEVDAAFQLGMLKKPWLYKLALRLERAALRSFSHVSTISPNMRKKLLEKGVEEDKALLIQNWANTDIFSPEKGEGKWADTFKKDPETILALYSGNLGQKQGLETLVDSAKLLKDEKNIHFVICGDGAGRQDMERRAKGLKNITFLPLQPMEDFIHLMIAADIHLLPQKADAADLVMPSKLGNILASGRPVVAGASKGTQVYDAVEGCGLAVKPELAEDFAKAIKKLADDKPLRNQMGIEGQKRAASDWSKESLLLKMEKSLSERIL